MALPALPVCAASSHDPPVLAHCLWERVQGPFNQPPSDDLCSWSIVISCGKTLPTTTTISRIGVLFNISRCKYRPNEFAFPHGFAGGICDQFAPLTECEGAIAGRPR